MADNVDVVAGVATYKASTDKVTYSGDANTDVQLVRSVHVTGSEGSKTVVDLTSAAGTSPAGAMTVQGHASGVALPVSLATLPALVAGTAAIGKLAANSGVDIGDVDVTSCALPTGAATAAKQPALGTAGSASADVITVQGIASGTALNVTAAGAVASGATDSGNPVKVGGKYNSTPITLTDGQRGDAQLDASGYLKVNVAAGSAANAAASATGSAVPASADYQGLNVGGTLRGATGLGVGSHFAGTVAVVDASGNQITSFGGSAGVVSALHFVAAASANATNVKASAGTLRGFSVFNKSDVPIYLKFHNTAGTPTAGSGVVRTFGIQAGESKDITIPGGGISFATGIAFTLVQDIADAGTTAVAASDAAGEIFYE